MESTALSQGNLVALEGRSSLVSTQLRLLPNSSDILTLPDVRHYLTSTGGIKFRNAPSFIRSVHEAAKLREEAALRFLRDASPTEKKLVFLSGGTASAYALCIASISEHETRGNLHEAETIFRNSVQEGLKGLPVVEPEPASSESGEPPQSNAHDDGGRDKAGEDPGLRAMRAAEALDLETAALQEDSTLDLTFKPRPRSMSLPLYGFSEDPNDTTPYLILGVAPPDTAPKESQDDSVATPTAGPRTASNGKRLQFSIPENLPSTRQSGGPSGAAEADEPTIFQAKKGLAFRNAVLVDTSVDSRPSSVVSPALQRTRSLGRFHATYRTKVHDRRSVLELSYRPPGEAESIKTGVDGAQLEETSDLVNQDAQESRLIPLKLGASRRAPGRRLPPRLRIPSYSVSKAIYVDKGTDSSDLSEPKQMEESETQPEPSEFQPVLPFIEDLVIQLRDDETPDCLLKSVIQSFKDAQYPILHAPLRKPVPPGPEEPLAFPATPTSPQGPMFITPQPAHMDTPPWTRHDEYDPFAPQTYLRNAQGRRPSDFLETPFQGDNVIKPPTPMSTPPPSQPDIGHKFLNIQTCSGQTAVSVQNSLRSVLESYYPIDGEVCSPFLYHVLPKMARLWGPLFDKAGKSSEKRNVDLILAIGSEEGVEQEYNSTISSQIEKMGIKSTGETRSGRVDIRYLIVNALQSAAARSLHRQARDHSALSASELAALVISQLDIYFRTHASVRFLLLEYPHDQLGTMLALQEFIGSDTMKIAGVILSSDSPITKRALRDSPPRSPLSPASPRTRAGGAPFSKANYLLTSTATDSEIATFMSAIWKTLMDISPFYNPEQPPAPAPAPAPARKLKPRKDLSIRTSPLPSPTYSAMPTPRSVSARQHRVTSIVFHSPSSPPQSPLPDTPSHYRGRRPDSPAPSARSKGSAADTVRTTSGTVRSSARGPPAGKAYRFFGGGAAAEQQSQPPTPRVEVTSAFSDDSDSSEFDLEEERRLMPLFARTVAAAAGGLARPPSRKGNSRKALKWLGLA